MRKEFRIVSALLIVVLLMSALATQVPAGLGNDKGQDRQGGQQFSAIGAEVRVAADQPPIRKFQDTSETMTISPDKIFWDEKNDPYAVRITWELDEVEEQSSTFFAEGSSPIPLGRRGACTH